MDVTNETIAALLGDSISSVTIHDRARAEPIVECSSEFEFAVGEDGNLLIRVTPPEKYDKSVTQSVIKEESATPSGRH
jgi:hypothetical protein